MNLPTLLAGVILLLGASAARAGEQPVRDKAEMLERRALERPRCPRGYHRISGLDEPLECWPHAPVCKKGFKAVKGTELEHPWHCVHPTGKTDDCPEGMNCDGCPAGQHNELTHTWGQPYKCVSNYATLPPGQCPPGWHPKRANEQRYPGACVLDNYAERSGDHSFEDDEAAAKKKHPAGENAGRGIACMKGMHAVSRPGQRPHCEP